ncbi:MAG: hypothetical protein FWC50_15490, partial [Planctomycetaceae bacterium]|nr:hypothetical protein [Planctomycetaceae bacterium]
KNHERQTSTNETRIFHFTAKSVIGRFVCDPGFFIDRLPTFGLVEKKRPGEKTNLQDAKP